LDFLGEPLGKWLLGRPRRKWEDNIEMNCKEIGCEVGSGWMELAEDCVDW
jgi:hypothetical protein